MHSAQASCSYASYVTRQFIVGGFCTSERKRFIEALLASAVEGYCQKRRSKGWFAATRCALGRWRTGTRWYCRFLRIACRQCHTPQVSVATLLSNRNKRDANKRRNGRKPHGKSTFRIYPRALRRRPWGCTLPLQRAPRTI